jgi:peptidylprolyl isomerase
MILKPTTTRLQSPKVKITMLTTKKLLTTVALTGAAVVAYSYSAQHSNRRTFLTKSAAGVTAASLGGTILPKSAFADDSSDPYGDFITTDSGLRYKVIKEGDGAIPSAGTNVKAHYTGWLDGFNSDKKFDSSRDRGRPFSFKAGAGQVIRGWDESFLSMKVGERRQIIIPPRLGYGDRGAGGIIPGGATLYFDVELLAIQ